MTTDTTPTRIALSRNLYRDEFACKCGCGFDTADFELVKRLQKLVNTVGRELEEPHSIILTSGCRCVAHNALVGGASDSQHLYGRAADFYLVGRESKTVVPSEVSFRFLDKLYPDRYGMGLYSTWVHFDTRTKKARWERTK